MLSKSVLSKYIADGFPSIKGLSDDAVKVINAMIERVLEVLYPVDSSTHPARVLDRVNKLSSNVPWVLGVLDLDDQYKAGLPLDKIKKMVKDAAGNVLFPEDAENFASLVVETFINSLIGSMTDGLAIQSPIILEASNIIDFLYNRRGLAEIGFDKAPFGPLDKAKVSVAKRRKSRRKSSSKRRKSSSKRRCPANESRVKSFIRDGKRVKSYCRKSQKK